MMYKGPRTIEELAAVLGMDAGRLDWLTRDRPIDTGTHYRHFRIAKRDGRSRMITAPKRHLKTAQRAALKLIWATLPTHDAAHGFRPGRSIATNAAPHAGASVVVKLDIREFFPSVRARRVAGWLRVKAGAPADVAEVLARLATEPPRKAKRRNRRIVVFVATGPRALPQGAPSSPAITNVLCRRMDRRLAKLARRHGLRFTRYADDLTFSWHGAAHAAPVDALVRLASAIVQAEGFRVNARKTRIVRAGSRQSVTGLVVNAAPGAPAVRVPRDVLRRLRAALHNREHGRPGPDSLDKLRGLVAFVCSIDPARGEPLRARLAALKEVDSDEGG